MFALLQSCTQFQKLSLFPFGEIHGGGLQSGYDWYHRVDGIKGGDAATDHTRGTTKCIKDMPRGARCRPSVQRPAGVDDGDFMQIFG